MSSSLARHIPNAVTCCNLFCGCVAAVMALRADYEAAVAFILLGAVCDFFDGMLARLFRVSGPLGKELDSLADDITFGFAPSAVVFSLFREVRCPDFLLPVAPVLPYAAFLVAVFSALRLGKFNIDPRQATSFIGMPTPANALFWGSLAVGARPFLLSGAFNALWLLVMVAATSWLLVAEIPMFSLKFRSLSWRENRLRYLFLAGCLPLLLLFGAGGFAVVVVWYVLLSFIRFIQSHHVFRNS